MKKKKYLYAASLSAIFNMGIKTVFVKTVATHWQDVEDEDMATGYFLQLAERMWPNVAGVYTNHEVVVILAHVNE